MLILPVGRYRSVNEKFIFVHVHYTICHCTRTIRNGKY